jgi:hypothetical protein
MEIHKGGLTVESINIEKRKSSVIISVIIL